MINSDSYEDSYEDEDDKDTSTTNYKTTTYHFNEASDQEMTTTRNTMRQMTSRIPVSERFIYKYQ